MRSEGEEPPYFAEAPQNTPSPRSPTPPHTPQIPAPKVLVLATPATVHSRAYTHALARLGIPAAEKACPLLVPLVEEGWIDHHVTREVAYIYLSEALADKPFVTTLLLGCTHYPLLRNLLAETLATLNRPLDIIDSADATAHAVAAHLHPLAAAAPSSSPPKHLFFATDSIQKFQHLGCRFLGQPLPEVHLIDLGG